MAAYAFAVPIIPGQEEADRQFSNELLGARKDEFAASRRRHGITREMVYLQQTPDGPLAVVLLEGPDPMASVTGLATSQDPFDVWWRSKIQEIHGFDLAQGMPGPPNELLLDHQAS